MKTAHGAARGQGTAGGRFVFGRPSPFKGGGRPKNNREKLDIFLDSPRVQLFYIDEITSDYYAVISNSYQENRYHCQENSRKTSRFYFFMKNNRGKYNGDYKMHSDHCRNQGQGTAFQSI